MYMYCGTVPNLTTPSRSGRHMREKGALVGPDTFLARTLFLPCGCRAKQTGGKARDGKVGCVGCLAVGCIGCGLVGLWACGWVWWAMGKGQRERQQSRLVGLHQSTHSINQYSIYVHPPIHPYINSGSTRTKHTPCTTCAHAHAHANTSTNPNHLMSGLRTSDASPGNSLILVGAGQGQDMAGDGSFHCGYVPL